jgi:long-subunit acyl-CoA synthetase (AMP-forming)
LLYDLALIELRAISVAFTDDFRDVGAEELCDKYRLSLLLVSSADGLKHESEATFVAYLDGDNIGIKKAIERGEPPVDENFDTPWLIFSSGSAGGLKGLMLNRRGVEASLDAFNQAVVPRHDDCVLLFLPISNFQQRLIYYSALWHGFDLIVTDPPRLFRALKELKPTILIAPPTLYEVFETRFFNLPKWKRLVAQIAGGLALNIPIGPARKWLARLIFKDIYEAFGGRMRFMITGMAPIKRSTLKLFERIQLPLFETYGLIECGSVALNVPSSYKLGSVGRLLPGVDVELAEDGEIIVHKEHMMALDYFECAEGESERTFIGNKRVATGDIGYLDKDGYLYLIGRKKEIIVTAGGEKIHPEALESEIDACQDVKKSVVFGSQDVPFLVAVVLPNNPQDSEAKTRIERFIEGINERRTSMQVEKVVFTELELTRENGFLRPNLKLDRKRIAEHFCADIAEFSV